MLIGSECNGMCSIGLLDYAYLALNVYHGKGDDKLLGYRPQVVHGIVKLIGFMKKNNGWIQLDFPVLNASKHWTFHAELYAKTYGGKIQHLMLAFRGTNGFDDYTEDAMDWWNTVLPGGENIHLTVPHYWKFAKDFIMRCNAIIQQLDDNDLLATYCQQHVTGHSLGGAMANLVAGTGIICKPPMTKSHLPVMPNVISFNAPGIGAMKHIDRSPFAEGQVISMRAEYDMVSALGEPYGYVINNIVPDGFAEAKIVFETQQHLEKPSTLKDQLCRDSSVCVSLKRAAEVTSSKEVLQQHYMGNFMRMLEHNPSVLTMDLQQLRSWAKNHGGKNHDHLAPPLFSDIAAKAA